MVQPRVALTYLRISEDRENDELALARQRKELAEYADRQGWRLGGEYLDNDVSASRGLRRAGYEALLQAVSDGKGDVILCTEQTRLTRGRMTELEGLIDVVNAAGVDIAALRGGGVIDLSTSGGRAQARILGVMARLEVEQMSERIKSKLRQNADAGRAHGGPRPYGYKRVDGRLVIEEAEAEILREMAQRVLAGESMRSLCEDMNERGVAPARASHWRGPVLRYVLTTPRIAGLVPRAGGAGVEGDWEPILDRVTWERLRSVLAKPKRGARPRSYLLTGFLRCGQCGRRLYSKAGNGRRLYACRREEDPGACGSNAVEAGRVEETVCLAVLDAIADTDVAEVRAERTQSETARLVAEVADDEALLSELAGELAARRLSRSEWATARPIIEGRLVANRAALAALGAQPLPADVIAIDDDAFAELGFDAKRSLLGIYLDRVEVAKSTAKRGARFDPGRIRILWRA